MFSTSNADSPQDAEPSGFHEFSDGLLDHLAEANERIELDLFDNQVDVVPELAPRLLDGEQGLVDKMQATVDNAQEAAQQRRIWDPSSVALAERRLHAAVQKQQPSEADEAVRRRVLQDVNALVQPGLLGYTGMHVAPYGSFVSGLYTSTGDLDIAIEGFRTQGSEQIPCAELGKEDKIQLLKALGKKLTNARMVRGQMERILHARVPIIKFKHSATGLDCDISVASGGARFKSTVLHHLAEIDSRFGSLVRLVKLWAGAHGMNDAAAGTFNSFALTLMVAFHLQMQQPPILPPLCALFQQSPDVLKGRPLHAGQQAREGVLEACGEQAWTEFVGYGKANSASLTDLLASFFVLCHTAVQRWSRERSTGLRYVRISTWCGTWTYRAWTKKYCVGVEDPFDCTDNCARTIAPHASSSVANKFGDAMSAMSVIESSTVPPDAQDEGPQSLMQRLFTKPPPKVRSAEKESGGRSRGRGGRTMGPVRYLPVPTNQEPMQGPDMRAYGSQIALQRPPGLDQSPVSSTPLLTQLPSPPHRHLQGIQQPYSPHASSEPPTRPPPRLEGRFANSQQLGLQRVPSDSTSQQGSAEVRYGQVHVLAARQPRQHRSLDHNAGLRTAGSSGWDHDLSKFNPAAGTQAANDGSDAQHAQQRAGFQSEHFGIRVPARHAQQPAGSRSEYPSSDVSAQHAQQPHVNHMLGRLRVDDHVQPNSLPGSSSSHQQYAHPNHLINGQHSSRSGVILTDRPKLGLQPQQGQRNTPYEPHKQPESPACSQDGSQISHQRHQGFQSQIHPQAQFQSFSGYGAQALVPSQGFLGHDAESQQVESWDPSSSSTPADEQWQIRDEPEQSQDERQRQASTGMLDRAPSRRVLTVPCQPSARSQFNRTRPDGVVEYGPQDVSYQGGDVPKAGLTGDELGPSANGRDDFLDDSKLEQGGAKHRDTEPAAQSNSSKKKENHRGYWKKRKQFYRGRGGRGGHQQGNEQH
ncbi:hypothetical protein WJX77_005588 [Trebouxia sp. C0004]